MPLDKVRLRPPLPRPVTVVCMAVNYMEDGTRSEPAPINAFLKAPSAIIGDGDTMVLPDAPATMFEGEAEMALVAVPEKQDQPSGTGPIAADKFRGKVPKVIDYLEQLAAAAAPDTPWATDSKKLAEALKKDPAEFINVQRALFVYQPPTPGKVDPEGPLSPIGGLPGAP